MSITARVSGNSPVMDHRVLPGTWISSLLLITAGLAHADLSFTAAGTESNLSLPNHTEMDLEKFGLIPPELRMAGGVAAADYDRDGDIDLYLISGETHPNFLMNNDGSGVFSVDARSPAIFLQGQRTSAPAFADLDSDGWPDLVVGGIFGQPFKVFMNQGDGTFADASEASGIVNEADQQNNLSSAFGDPDKDGDLDMYTGHWGADEPVSHLWLNRGDGTFHPADGYAGISPTYQDEDWSFAPSFSDFTNDGHQDLIVVADFNTSHTLINDGQVHFNDTTTAEISDESGMGSAIGDIDNDGDMDWFVTAIWWGDDREGQGNRLYRNDGAGNLADVTESAGVRVGDWGWSACAQDFNNDGWLDLFHVNGFWWNSDIVDYSTDRSRLFINQGDGQFFTEQSVELGIDDPGQGRGLVCFDADNDGDIDIFSANIMGLSTYWRNDLDDNPGWLQVKLDGETNNPSAVAARVELTANGVTQLREVRVGSNFQSQDPLVQHFGLGGAETVSQLKVTWPHGGETVLSDVAPNQKLVLSAADASPPPFEIQPGISGAWVDPALSREGFVIEILPGGIAVLFWFTYDNQGNQDWYIATGTLKGRRIFFKNLLSVSGATFGADEENEPVVETPVGSATFTWTDCDSGIMDWRIGEDFGHLDVQRLSTLMGATCGDKPDMDVTDMANRSGAWIDQDRDGEGYVLEILESGIAVVFYFGFDAEGNRRWLIGVGTINDGVISFNVNTTSGGNFNDPANDVNAIESPWGTLEMEISCTGGTGDYASTEEGFGEGTYQLVRLSSIDGLACP